MADFIKSAWLRQLAYQNELLDTPQLLILLIWVEQHYYTTWGEPKDVVDGFYDRVKVGNHINASKKPLDREYRRYFVAEL